MKHLHTLSLLPILALASGAVGAREIPLADVVVIEAGFSRAFSVVSADLDGDGDGDGDLDLVYSEANNDVLDTASVLWAENDGSPGVSGWTERTLAGSLPLPTGVVVADFDRDGDPDVAVAVYFGGAVQWYQNDGTPLDGGWTAHWVTSGFEAVQLEAVDMDGDGDPDLVGTEQAFGGAGDRLTWWENDGTPDDGAWVGQDLATALADPLGLDAGDVDGDGDVDVAATVRSSTTPAPPSASRPPPAPAMSSPAFPAMPTAPTAR
jgi:hypothetical protein